MVFTGFSMYALSKTGAKTYDGILRVILRPKVPGRTPIVEDWVEFIIACPTWTDTVITPPPAVSKGFWYAGIPATPEAAVVDEVWKGISKNSFRLEIPLVINWLITPWDEILEIVYW